MPSLISQLMNTIVRVATPFAWRGPFDVDARRAAMLRAEARSKLVLPDGVSMEDVTAPLPGRWLRSQHPRGKTILYLHGGAFLFRMPRLHTPFVARLVSGAGANAFIPWYRLAPEHPFPAAPQDCLAAYRHLLKQVAAQTIVVIGDSAGGNTP